MINKVNGNDYYDYSKLKMPDAADKMDNGEKFSLNYQNAQGEPEEKDKKDKDKVGKTGEAAGRRAATVMQGGVRLELSHSGQTASGTERDRTDEASERGTGLLETIQSWLRAFVQWCREIAYRIWNDPAPAEDTAEDAASQETQEPERLTEEYLALNDAEVPQTPEETEKRQMSRGADRDKEIQKYLRSGNLEQVISLVTDNGRKTMAKNSTLLTYYDRTGRIATLSVSDQERILHGDRNVKKL